MMTNQKMLKDLKRLPVIYNNKSRDKLNYYFRVELSMKDSTNGFMRSNCPFCNGNFCFGVNLETNKAHCFKCDYESTPVRAVMELNNFEQYSELTKFLNDSESWDFLPKIKREKRVEARPVELPPFYRAIRAGTSHLARAARNYMKGRGFDLIDLTYRGVGYCYDGEYMGYIVIPYYHEGKLIYWKTRSYIGAKSFKNPDETMFGIGKSQLIYNIDALGIYNKVNIVESETNALTLGDNTIGLAGKSISPWQLSCLIKSPVKQFNIILDPDAQDKALDLAMKLTQYKKVKNVSWDNSGFEKEYDVNDMGKSVTKWFIKHTPIRGYSELFRDKLNLRA